MNKASESLRYSFKPVSSCVGPPSLQHRSASSLGHSELLLRPSSIDESSTIRSPRLSADTKLDDGDQTLHDNQDCNAKMGLTSNKQASPTDDLSFALASCQKRAISPKLLSTYNDDYGNPNYTDIFAPHLADALESRLEAIRVRNAEENYHWRIPPQDAPPHMQMMVLLYQWAAWALEISDKRKREKMLKWVNGRTLDFMMSGGRLPGYNLKELLEIASVDPRELYQNGGQPVQHDTSMAKMNSSKPAARTNMEQSTAAVTGSKAGTKQSDREVLDQDDEASTATPLVSPSGNQKRHLLEDHGEDGVQDTSEIDHSRHEPATLYRKITPEESDESVQVTASVLAYQGPSARKRHIVPDVEQSDQNKRKKTSPESTKQDSFPASRQNDSDSVASPRAIDMAYPVPQEEARRKEYRQTFFKAQLNAVLKTHRKPQFKKDLPSWSELVPRLHHSKLSATTIELLKEDYENGWKTWDGSAFCTLPESLRNNDQEENIKAKHASPPSTSTKAPSAQMKGNNKLKIRITQRARTRAASQDYDSGDGELTAARTSVTTRQQASKPSAPKENRGGASKANRKA